MLKDNQQDFVFYFQLDADRDMEEMFFDISKLFDFAFFADDSGEKVSIVVQLFEPCREKTCLRGC